MYRPLFVLVPYLEERDERLRFLDELRVFNRSMVDWIIHLADAYGDG